jgi:dihydrolipoamide dehydrogenase
MDMERAEKFDTDYLIIGSGPGGDAAANRLGQLGAKAVVLVEQGQVGGACVNWGCIPTHFLLENLLLRQQISEAKNRHRLFSGIPEVDFQALKSGTKKVIENLQLSIMQSFEKNGVEFIRGKGRLITPHRVEITRDDGTTTFKTPRTIIIASGAPFTALHVSGMESAREHLIRADRVMALDFEHIPDSIVIYGLDSPAVELASFFHFLGSKVALLSPQASAISYGSQDLRQSVEDMLAFHDVDLYTDVELNRLAKADGRLLIEFAEKGKEGHRLTCQYLVDAYARQANLECIENLPIRLEGNRPSVSENFQSSQEDIYFLGDVRSGAAIPFRSHLAAFSGRILADRLMGNPDGRHLDMNLLLMGMVTIDFQIAKIGLTKQEAISQGHAVRILRTPNSHNAHAQILGKPEGYVLLVVEIGTEKILGGEIVGTDAINLITVIGTAMACEGRIQDLKKFPAFHPSLAEGIFDTAWSEPF